MRRNRNVVQDLLPGWEDGTFQEGGLGRFRFLVLVICFSGKGWGDGGWDEAVRLLIG